MPAVKHGRVSVVRSLDDCGFAVDVAIGGLKLGFEANLEFGQVAECPMLKVPAPLVSIVLDSQEKVNSMMLYFEGA